MVRKVAEVARHQYAEATQEAQGPSHDLPGPGSVWSSACGQAGARIREVAAEQEAGVNPRRIQTQPLSLTTLEFLAMSFRIFRSLLFIGVTAQR